MPFLIAHVISNPYRPRISSVVSLLEQVRQKADL
jgi:hypothetical protein